MSDYPIERSNLTHLNQVEGDIPDELQLCGVRGRRVAIQIDSTANDQRAADVIETVSNALSGAVRWT